MIKIQATDRGISAALNRLIAASENTQPYLTVIGKQLQTFTEQRFEKSTDPYGTSWKANSQSTRGKPSRKPLIGRTGALSTRINQTILKDIVTISSPMAYAATQQFGAKKGAFGKDRHNRPIPWGDIPARPFLPGKSKGLPEQLAGSIHAILKSGLQRAWDGR